MSIFAEFFDDDSLPPLVIDFDPPLHGQSAINSSFFNENENSLPPLVIDFDPLPHHDASVSNSTFVNEIAENLQPLVIGFNPSHEEKNELLTNQALVVKNLPNIEVSSNPLPLILTFNQQAVFKTNMIKRKNRDWEVLSLSNKIRPYWIEEHSDSESLFQTPLTKRGQLRNVLVFKEIYFKVFSRKQDFVYYMDIYKLKTGRLCCSVGSKTNFIESLIDLKKEAKKAIKNWHKINCKRT